MLTRDQITNAIRAAAERYPILRVHLFGSYADGTATEDSDVDVYVEFAESPISFFRLMGLRGLLERLLEKEIDIVKQPPEDEDADSMVCIYEKTQE